MNKTTGKIFSTYSVLYLSQTQGNLIMITAIMIVIQKVVVIIIITQATPPHIIFISAAFSKTY